MLRINCIYVLSLFFYFRKRKDEQNENERKNEKNDVVYGRYPCWSMDHLYDHCTAKFPVSDHVIGHSGMGNCFNHASAKRERAGTETPCDAGH